MSRFRIFLCGATLGAISLFGCADPDEEVLPPCTATSPVGARCRLPLGGEGVCLIERGGCVESLCGDGFLDTPGGETCDDGNQVTEVCAYDLLSCTVCAETCQVVSGATSYCGDGTVDDAHAELCDDGNSGNGDGCTMTCDVEPNWFCDAGEPSECRPVPVLISLSGATFSMGAPEEEVGRHASETQHDVTLTHGYSLSATEVTQFAFERMMGWNPSASAACDTCPVENVSWYDGAAYLNSLTLWQHGVPCYVLTEVVCHQGAQVGADYMACMSDSEGGIHSAVVSLNNVDSVYDCSGFRFPTEAEWEYAARAGDVRATYAGDLPDEALACETPNPVLDGIAWFCGNAGGGPHAVGSLAPNNEGFFDMLGNVAEWCHDVYADYPGGSI